ncbi:MAG: MBL fold metallo-hydrolase [Eubacteriaceae bacterium]|nr:MBL fold metallo-hydrolase [Eubacteriaceae bacterium]
MFSQSKIDIVYIANSGVLLSSKETKILIDGIHTTNVQPYFSVAPKTVEKIVLNKEPYDNIDLIFFTHHHADHYDPAFTSEFLANNKLVQMVATTSVLSQLSSAGGAYNDNLINQIRPLSLPRYKSLHMNLRSVPFEVYSIAHDGETYQGVENFAYLIELRGKTILHVGDAQPTVFNFQSAGLYGKKVDILIAPFPFIGLVAGRKIIKSMNPQLVIVTHLPNKAQDEGNWLYNTYRAFKKYESQMPQTTFYTKPGQKVSI